jgi:hypothetical protein
MLAQLDRLHGNRQQIVNQPDLLLQEWLGVGDATEGPAVACHRLYAGMNFVVRGEKIFAGLLIAELRRIRQNGSELLLELLADVDHEGGAYVIIERGIDYFEGAMRCERLRAES